MSQRQLVRRLGGKPQKKARHAELQETQLLDAQPLHSPMDPPPTQHRGPGRPFARPGQGAAQLPGGYAASPTTPTYDKRGPGRPPGRLVAVPRVLQEELGNGNH